MTQDFQRTAPLRQRRLVGWREGGEGGRTFLFSGKDKDGQPTEISPRGPPPPPLSLPGLSSCPARRAEPSRGYRCAATPRHAMPRHHATPPRQRALRKRRTYLSPMEGGGVRGKGLPCPAVSSSIDPAPVAGRMEWVGPTLEDPPAPSPRAAHIPSAGAAIGSTASVNV